MRHYKNKIVVFRKTTFFPNQTGKVVFRKTTIFSEKRFFSGTQLARRVSRTGALSVKRAGFESG